MSDRAVSITLGMRVMPPTSTSSSTVLALHFASFKQSLTGLTVRSKRSSRQLLKLGAGQLLLDVLRTRLVRRDKWQVDLVFLGRWKARSWLFRIPP